MENYRMDVFIDDDELAEIFAGTLPEDKISWPVEVIREFKRSVTILDSCINLENIQTFESLKPDFKYVTTYGLHHVDLGHRYKLKFSITQINYKGVLKDVIRIKAVEKPIA